MHFGVVGHVRGITCLDGKLYVVYKSSHRIHVFTAGMHSKVAIIKVHALQDPTDIVACRDGHQLYASDREGRICRVSAVNPDDQEKWLTDDALRGFCTLSVASQRLLVTLPGSRSLRQYSTTNRQLLRVIDCGSLSHRFHSVEPSHSAETTRGTFVVICERKEMGGFMWSGLTSEAVSELFRFTICLLV